MELMIPVYVGLDYHDDTIRACILTEDGVVLANRNLPNEVGAVRELVHRHGGVVRGVAIEACCGSADFATQLEALTDWTVKLAHPAGVHQLKKGPDHADPRRGGELECHLGQVADLTVRG
jgi:hypothetical protein